jgi:hypothetical protein
MNFTPIEAVFRFLFVCHEKILLFSAHKLAQPLSGVDAFLREYLWDFFLFINVFFLYLELKRENEG